MSGWTAAKIVFPWTGPAPCRRAGPYTSTFTSSLEISRHGSSSTAGRNHLAAGGNISTNPRSLLMTFSSRICWDHSRGTDNPNGVKAYGFGKRREELVRPLTDMQYNEFLTWNMIGRIHASSFCWRPVLTPFGRRVPFSWNTIPIATWDTPFSTSLTTLFSFTTS